MLQKIFNNKKNRQWIFTSLLLTSFLIYFFGILDPNQVILLVAPENTPPTRFDIAFGGAFKINQKISDSLKYMDYNDCCADAINEDDFFETGDFASDNIYIVTFDVIGLKESESSYYPLLKVKSHRKIHIIPVYLCLIVISLIIGNTLYVIRNYIKEETSSLKRQREQIELREQNHDYPHLRKRKP